MLTFKITQTCPRMLRQMNFFALASFCIAIHLPVNTFGAKAEAPNIVFFFIDDFGYGDLSIYGNTNAETPAFDRLAREGIKFTQAYVNSSICSPARVAVTTGQYPQRWRIDSFLSRREDNARRGMADFLDLRAPSLARKLQANGYRTAHIGKWHMGGARDVDNAPWITEYGFDESVANHDGMGDRIMSYFDEHRGGGRTLGTVVVSARQGRGSLYWTPRSQTTEVYVDRAIEYIDRVADSRKPFYLNLWTMDTHTPYEPPLERRGDRSPLALISGVIEEMDLQFSRLFEFIENDPRLRDNTLIIVSSDNGALTNGPGSNGILRGGKGNVYEGGIRVPMIIWSPNLIAEERIGSVDDQTIFSMMDLPASLLSLAGIREKGGAAFDGEDLSPALRGTPVDRSRPLFWTRPIGEYSPQLAMRDGDWKLLVDRDGSRIELYNLAEDPRESANLASREAERARLMSEQLLAWDAEVRANAVVLPLEDRPARLPAPAPSPGHLFVDNFNRGNDEEIDASTDGVSGLRGHLFDPGNVYLRAFQQMGDRSDLIRNEAMHMAVGSGPSELAINHNFVDDEIIATGGFRISMEIVTIESLVEELEDRYAGFGVGLSAEQAARSGHFLAGDGRSFRGSPTSPGAAAFFVELDMERNVKVWVDGKLVGTAPVTAAFGHLEARFDLASGFNQGDWVEAGVYFNGKKLEIHPVSGSDPAKTTFRWPHADSNFVGISANASDRVIIDNLVVETLHR